MPGLHWNAALIGFALVAGPALAQSTVPANPLGQPGTQGQGQFLSQAPNTYLRCSRLVGVEVMGQDHVKLGTIEELLVDGNGQIQAAVIGAGGVLGLGEKRVAVPFNLLLWNTGDVARAQAPSASNTAGAPGNTGPVTSTPGTGANANSAPGGTMDDAARRGPATVPVMPADGRPERALLRLTREDLQNAPEFRYDASAGVQRR